MVPGETPEFTPQASSQDYDPTYIHFFGIRRSGNHAVIHWLSEGLRGEGEHTVMHFNNVAEDSSSGPVPERQPVNIKREVARLHPDFVILSYEERTVTDRRDIEHRSTFSNDRDQDLVLLRSFPNVMASQIQRRHNVIEEGRLNRPILRLGLAAIRDIWVENAQAILDSTDGSLTAVLFDKWFTDRNYRDVIANRVGFTNTDSGIDDVPDLAGVGGSSFDGTAYQGRAQEMHVLDRWQMFGESEENRRLYAPLVTAQVVELNLELFGSDPSLEG